MSLRNICRNFSAGKPFLPRLPAEAATLRSARRIGAREVAAAKPREDELEASCARLHAALASDAPLSNRDLRHAPWCVFTTSRPLQQEPARLEQLLDRIDASARIRLFRALASVYLHFFDPENAAIGRIAEFLATRLEAIGSPWREAHGAVQIFSPESAARNIAAMALEEGSSPDDALEGLGFAKLSGLGALREHVYLRGLEEIASRRDLAALERLALVRDWATQGGKLRFHQARAPMANALLLPFSGVTPEKRLRDEYLGFILPLLGDPRTNSSSWIRCDSAALVVRKWLTEIALKQFFDIVDKIAPPGHWAYRRAFWSAVEKEDCINDAWVVFEKHGASAARQMFGPNIDFGTFDTRAKKVLRGHAVLLLRIGTLVVVEWSHTGTCRIWDENSGRRPPELSQPVYTPDELQREMSQAGPTGQGVFGHHGSSSYHWQSQIAAFLKERRNIHIAKSSYELR
jgi:hypothetical protein